MCVARPCSLCCRGMRGAEPLKPVSSFLPSPWPPPYKAKFVQSTMFSLSKERISDAFKF